MGEGEVREVRKIRKIIVGLGGTSLEPPFLWALLMIARLRRYLGVKEGEVKWAFQSTARLTKPDPAKEQELDETFRRNGIVWFNTGGGGLDQHGKVANQSLCEMCSLDLVRGEYDFISHRPWLRPIFSAIRQNDIDGTEIPTTSKENIRTLMSGTAVAYPAELALEILGLAFCGVFERAKESVPLNQVFNLEEIKRGIAECRPEKSEWFNDQIRQAQETLGQDWQQALADVKRAESYKKVRTWSDRSDSGLPVLLGRSVRVIELRSDAFSAAKAARYRGYDLVVVHRPNGHCQIFSSILCQYGDKEGGSRPVIGKWKFDLGEIAKRFRILEANFAQPRQRLERGDWTSLGFVYYENDEACPWYLPDFRTSLFNGSLSSPNVPQTKIRHDKILAEVITCLPNCRLLRQEGDSAWHHMDLADLPCYAAKKPEGSACEVV